MNVTVFSFFMSVLFSTLFIAAIHLLLRNQTFFFQSFGVHTILGLYVLCLFRTAAILELPFTVPIGLRNVYSTAFETVWTAQISAGGSQIRLILVLCGIWVVVSTTLIVQFLWKNKKATRKAKWYSTNQAPFAEQVLEQVKRESWWTPKVSVCICPTLEIPMGIGLFRHRICLPEQEYARGELYYILKHEYTHFCNRDLTVKFLVHPFCCIFWWNPAVYLLKKDISQILEIKCDIKATERFSKKEWMEYLFTIVSILERANNAGGTPPPMLATGLACRENGGDMRERFRMITAAPRYVSRLCQVDWEAVEAARPKAPSFYSLTDLENWMAQMPKVGILAGIIISALVIWVFSCALIADCKSAFRLLLINGTLMLMLLGVVPPLLRFIDLPSPLLPSTHIVDFGYYAREFGNIFGALERFAAQGSQTAAEAVRRANSMLWLCGGLALALIGVTMGFCVAEQRSFRRCREFRGKNG